MARAIPGVVSVVEAKVSASTTEFNTKIKHAESVMNVFAGRIQKKLTTIRSSMGKLGSGIGAVARKMTSLPGLLTAGAGVLAAKELAKAGDAYVNLRARLEELTGSSLEAEEVQSRLFAMSQATGTAMLQNAEAFARLAAASEQTKLSNEETVRVVGALNRIMAASGVTSMEASAAMIQLSQAMASGKLQGDELRSIMEAAPAIMRKLAEAIGTDIGSLKELGAEGKLTSDVLGEAFVRIADDYESSVGQGLPETTARGSTRIKNALQGVWDSINENSNIIGMVTEKLNGVAEWITANEDVFVSWADAALERAKTAWPEIKAIVLDALNALQRRFAEWGPRVVEVFQRTIEMAEKFFHAISWAAQKWSEFKAATIDAAADWTYNLMAAPFGGSIGGGNETTGSTSGQDAARKTSVAGLVVARAPARTVNINVSQKVSRSDIVQIATEMQRSSGRY